MRPIWRELRPAHLLGLDQSYIHAVRQVPSHTGQHPVAFAQAPEFHVELTGTLQFGLGQASEQRRARGYGLPDRERDTRQPNTAPSLGYPPRDGRRAALHVVATSAR